jgi:hypothetical protein
MKTHINELLRLVWHEGTKSVLRAILFFVVLGIVLDGFLSFALSPEQIRTLHENRIKAQKELDLKWHSNEKK